MNWTLKDLIEELGELEDPSRVVNIMCPLPDGGTMLLDNFVIDEDENYVFLRTSLIETQP